MKWVHKHASQFRLKFLALPVRRDEEEEEKENRRHERRIGIGYANRSWKRSSRGLARTVAASLPAK